MSDIGVCDRCGACNADEGGPSIYAVLDELENGDVHTALCTDCFTTRMGRAPVTERHSEGT